jgi:hypothetical protein
MGTSIDVLFPRDHSLLSVQITSRLTSCFGRLENDLTLIRSHAWYSGDCGPWNVEHIAEHDGEPAYLFSEGPFGFDISVYANVMCLGHAERFRRLHYSDSPVAASLQHIISAIVTELSGAVPFAAVAGGMGDSDRAVDLAYYDAADFDAVVESLHQTLGEPSATWDALNQDDDRCWALLRRIVR